MQAIDRLQNDKELFGAFIEYVENDKPLTDEDLKYFLKKIFLKIPGEEREQERIKALKDKINKHKASLDAWWINGVLRAGLPNIQVPGKRDPVPVTADILKDVFKKIKEKYPFLGLE